MGRLFESVEERASDALFANGRNTAPATVQTQQGRARGRAPAEADMAWFGQNGESDAAARQAAWLAAQLSLPVEARSLTQEELTGRQRRVVRYMAIGLAVVATALIAAVAGELRDAPLKVFAILAPVALIGGLPLLLAVRWHRQRARDHRDPRIGVRVDQDGIVVGNGATSHAIGWTKIEARIESFTGRGGVRFVGLTVRSPLGEIRLDNDGYWNGRNAAAAVVLGMRHPMSGATEERGSDVREL